MADEAVTPVVEETPAADASLMEIMSSAGLDDDSVETGFEDDGEEEKGETPEAESAPAEEPAAETEAEPDPRDAAVAQLQQLTDAFTNDPAGFIKSLMSNLDPAQQAAILGKESAQPEASALPDNYEPANEFEETFLPVLKNLDKTVSGQVAREVGANIQQIVPYVDHANITVTIANAQIAALAEMMGVTLPAVNVSDIAKAVSTGRTTYSEAVNKAIGADLKAAVAAAKQAKAKRPDPAPSVSQQIQGLQRDARGQTSLIDIARTLGAK